MTGSSNASNSGTWEKDITSLDSALLEDMCDIDFGDSEACSTYRSLHSCGGVWISSVPSMFHGGFEFIFR